MAARGGPAGSETSPPVRSRSIDYVSARSRGLGGQGGPYLIAVQGQDLDVPGATDTPAELRVLSAEARTAQNAARWATAELGSARA